MWKLWPGVQQAGERYDRQIASGEWTVAADIYEWGSGYVSRHSAAYQTSMAKGDIYGAAKGASNATLRPGGEALTIALSASKAKWLTGARELATEGEFLTLVNPRNLRPIQGPAEMTGSRVKSISRDMRANGYDSKFPIEAVNVDARLIIRNGHHRTDAAIRAGIAEVPMRVVPVSPAVVRQMVLDAAEAAALRTARKGY